MLGVLKEPDSFLLREFDTGIVTACGKVCCPQMKGSLDARVET